jgi:hypothetical protein
MPDLSSDQAAPANGLFGPGIFGTGIDLSALDEATAWKLGTFVGEQLRAAEAAGRLDERAKVRAELLAIAAENEDGFIDSVSARFLRRVADRIAPEDTTPAASDD